MISPAIILAKSPRLREEAMRWAAQARRNEAIFAAFSDPRNRARAASYGEPADLIERLCVMVQTYEMIVRGNEEEAA